MLFAGDAGGFVNAITAEGIYYAMVVRRARGPAVAAPARGAMPTRRAARTSASWRAEIGAELHDAVLVQRYLFASHAARRARRARRRGVAGADATDSRLTPGDLSYAALRRRMLLRFPLTILRMARRTSAWPRART